MTINVVMQILGGIAFLAGAVISIKENGVRFKSGYKLQKNKDPLVFWSLVVFLLGIGLFLLTEATLHALSIS